MTVWFTSDTHFGHKFLSDLRGFGREYLDVHDQAILDNWNSVVGPRDVVYHLGDFSFHKRNGGVNEKIFAALNGEKHLIVGNHDPSHVRALPWASVRDLSTVSVGGQSLVLCHYPMLTWANAHRGVHHLHGHTHGNLDPKIVSTRMDVGVDCHPDRRPWSFEEVMDVLSTREYDYVDHHTRESAAREGY